MNLNSLIQRLNNSQKVFKNITAVSLCLLLSSYISAQCGSGLTVTLSTQTQVNELLTVTYPGCTNFLGNLTIQDDNNGIDNITTLAPLSTLTSVDGNLLIQANASLTNIDGLSALTSVGGILNIQSNNALTNVDDLLALTSVGGYLTISFNNALTNVDGLSALTSIGTNF